jgi:hypothetical protein
VAVAPLEVVAEPAAAPRLGRREVVGGDDLGLLEVDRTARRRPLSKVTRSLSAVTKPPCFLLSATRRRSCLQVDHLALVVDALAVRAEGVVGALEVDGEVPVVEHVVDLVLEVPLHGHHAQHLEEVVEGVLHAVVGLQHVVEHRVDGGLDAEVVGQLAAAVLGELLEEVHAEQHGREVLDDAHRHLAAVEQRLGHGARDLEVGGEVAPEAELDVPGREQHQVHRAQLAVGVRVLGLLGERRLVGVRRDDALEQRGLRGARLARDADGRLEVVAVHLEVGAPALLDLAPVEAAQVAVQRVEPLALHVVGLVLVDEDRHRARRREELEERELGLRRAVRLGVADAEERPHDVDAEARLARALRAPDEERREGADLLHEARLHRRGEEPAEDGQDDLGLVHLRQVRKTVAATSRNVSSSTLHVGDALVERAAARDVHDG